MSMNYFKKKSWVIPKNHSDFVYNIFGYFDRLRMVGSVSVIKTPCRSAYEDLVDLETFKVQSEEEFEAIHTELVKKYYHEVYDGKEKK